MPLSWCDKKTHSKNPWSPLTHQLDPRETGQVASSSCSGWDIWDKLSSSLVTVQLVPWDNSHRIRPDYPMDLVKALHLRPFSLSPLPLSQRPFPSCRSHKCKPSLPWVEHNMWTPTEHAEQQKLLQWDSDPRQGQGKGKGQVQGKKFSVGHGDAGEAMGQSQGRDACRKSTTALLRTRQEEDT